MSGPALAFPSFNASSTKAPISPISMPRSGSMALPAPSSTPGRQGPTTRTVAILMKAAAKVHRLAIQSRIIQAGFDIVLERSEKWTSPDDDDFLLEFLAHEPEQPSGPEPFLKWIPRLTNGANYILVLERHNAVATWLDLLGTEAGTQTDDDLQIGQDGLPVLKQGLRKAYGADALYGSPSDFAAQDQISFCFPELVEPSQNVEASPIKAKATSQTDRAESHSSETELSARSTKDGPAKVFKARPMPNTHKQASITPRLSKAAALRMGVQLPRPTRHLPSDASEKEPEGPVGISGIRKAEVQLPASLRPPTMAPRLNKAVAARLQLDSPVAPKVREKKEVDYSNTPGHKKNSTISVASTAAPTIAPRQTRASMGRISAYNGSPVTVRRDSSIGSTRASSLTSTGSGSTGEREKKAVDYSNTPGHKRASMSLSIPSLAAPTMAPRVNRASLARTSGLSSPSKENKPKTKVAPEELFVNIPGHKRKSMSFKLASLQAPTITPRSNNASAARLAARPSSAAGNRPSSRTSIGAPHQDGPPKVKGAAPPSSYKGPAHPPRPQSINSKHL